MKLEKEWKQRSHSIKSLLYHLYKQKPDRVLDLGCGNGWMSFQMARSGAKVTGLDLNMEELNQADQLFGEKVEFIYGDITQELDIGKYDLIVISAALQYFSTPTDLFEKLFSQYLNPNGSVMVMDSPFYLPKEIAGAKQRSNEYYNRLGVPEMANFYHHHTRDSLLKYKVSTLYRQSTIFKALSRLGFVYSSFPVYLINKQ